MKGALDIAIAAVLAAALAAPLEARAAQDDEPVEAVGVGVSGGILAGAELVLLLEAAIGVDETWALVVFPILGAGGGGAGGYYLREASPEAAVGVLVGSLALLIPTALAVTAVTAYDPEEEGAIQDESAGATFSFEQDLSESPPEDGTTTEVETRPDEIPEGVEDAPPAGPEPEGEPGDDEPAEIEAPDPETGSSADRTARIRRLASGALFYVGADGEAGLSVPAISVARPFPTQEEAAAGIKRGLEVRVPILAVDLP